MLTKVYTRQRDDLLMVNSVRESRMVQTKCSVSCYVLGNQKCLLSRGIGDGAEVLYQNPVSVTAW